MTEVVLRFRAFLGGWNICWFSISYNTLQIIDSNLLRMRIYYVFTLANDQSLVENLASKYASMAWICKWLICANAKCCCWRNWSPFNYKLKLHIEHKPMSSHCVRSDLLEFFFPMKYFLFCSLDYEVKYEQLHCLSVIDSHCRIVVNISHTWHHAAITHTKNASEQNKTAIHISIWIIVLLISIDDSSVLIYSKPLLYISNEWNIQHSHIWMQHTRRRSQSHLINECNHNKNIISN